MSIKNHTSRLRRAYFARLICRIIILILSLLVYFFRPQEFQILNGLYFFKAPSVFHILWIIWIADMIFQLIPVKNHIPLGSHKHLKYTFHLAKERISKKRLIKHIKSTTKKAYRVMLLWCLLLAVIATLYFTDVINEALVLLISIVFYVCDLICVLIWCPFRLIMKNKCCTTCRIFNWDHLMMFSPLAFIGSFFSLSLFVFSLIVFFVWELCVLMYPERFLEITNESLRCSNCTDKLCTQYCQKLRKK